MTHISTMNFYLQKSSFIARSSDLMQFMLYTFQLHLSQVWSFLKNREHAGKPLLQADNRGFANHVLIILCPAFSPAFNSTETESNLT